MNKKLKKIVKTSIVHTVKTVFFGVCIWVIAQGIAVLMFPDVSVDMDMALVGGLIFELLIG